MSKIDRAIMGTLETPKAFGSSLKAKVLETLEQIKINKPACGFDIEADSITAEPIMLGYSKGDGEDQQGFIIFNSAMEMLDIHTRHGFRETVNFYYNLQYDFEGMLKLFDKDISIMLYGSVSVHLTDTASICFEQDEYVYKSTYIPKKAFHTKVKGQKKYSYYDLLQYYQMKLDTAAKTYLGSEEGKDDFKAAYTSKPLFNGTSTVDQEIQRFEKHIFDNPLIEDKEKEKRCKEMKEFLGRFKDATDYRNTMIKYCIKDADICRRLGDIIIQGVNQFVNIKNFNSSATISEYYFRSNGLTLPKLAPSIFIAFMKSYYGGRFEITQKGFIPHINMYDIKSAYPYAMADMPILSKHPVIKKVYSMHDEALYGAYKINVTIPHDEYLSPLPLRDSLLFFPNGIFEEYTVDKITMKRLLDNGYDVKLIEAVEIYDDKHDFRLHDLILKLYNIKEDKKNQPEVVRLAAKIILNSLYGKFIQLVDDTGLELIKDMSELDSVSPSELFNIRNRYYKRVHTGNFRTGKLFAPYYASYITAHTRNYLYNVARRINMKNIIGFHTDSIMLKNVTLDVGHKLGDLEVEELKDKATGQKTPVIDANMYLLKSGMYRVEKDGLTKLRARGIGKPKDLLQDRFVVTRRLGLKQAIKKEFHKMNIISEQSVGNDLNSDMKRKWERQITMQNVINKEMVDSRPFIIV